MAVSKETALQAVRRLLDRVINGEEVRRVLVEERVAAIAEYYVSVSYDSATRGPVLSLARRGGTEIRGVRVFPIQIGEGLPLYRARQALTEAGFTSSELAGFSSIIVKLWKLFVEEYALLAEINPLFKTKEGQFLAGDAKVVLDDEKVAPNKRRFLELGGDIAVLASGGGASMLCLDMLLRAGGRPANYTEYSGNPTSSVVKFLTRRVLRQEGLRGCWVIGGTANFTDIYETMRGFIEGLRSTSPKPLYPIVIRRDGPRQQEAFAMLRDAAGRWGYDLHLFGPETPMAASGEEMVKLAYSTKRTQR